MTTPTGHPDFLGYSTWRYPAIAAQAYSVVEGTPLNFDQYVTQFAALQVALSVGANEGITFNLGWYTDSTFDTNIETNSWDLWNCSLQMIVPVLGPYCDVQIINGNATTATGNIYVAPLNVPTPVPRYTAGFNVIASNNESVAESATNTHQLGQVVEGTAWLFAAPLDASAKLNVTVAELNSAGTDTATLLAADALAAPVMLQSNSGRAPLQLSIANTDATAAHTLMYRLRTLTQ